MIAEKVGDVVKGVLGGAQELVRGNGSVVMNIVVLTLALVGFVVLLDWTRAALGQGVRCLSRWWTGPQKQARLRAP